jgi:hypothetical protein
MFTLDQPVFNADYQIVACEGATVDLSTVAAWHADYGIDRFMVCFDGHLAQVEVSTHPSVQTCLQVTVRRDDTGEPIVSIKYYMQLPASQARIESAQHIAQHAAYIGRYFATPPTAENLDSIAYHARKIAHLLDQMPTK